jgi:hypothetical protein
MLLCDKDGEDRKRNKRECGAVWGARLSAIHGWCALTPHPVRRMLTVTITTVTETIQQYRHQRAPRPSLHSALLPDFTGVLNKDTRSRNLELQVRTVTANSFLVLTVMLTPQYVSVRLVRRRGHVTPFQSLHRFWFESGLARRAGQTYRRNGRQPPNSKYRSLPSPPLLFDSETLDAP